MAARLKGHLPLDREKLLEECDDEQSYANRCLHVFVRCAQADIDGIAAAIYEDDFPQIAELAHRLKGASAAIKADFLLQEAARLEAFGRSEEPAAVEECLARLQAEFDHFKKFIATLSGPVNE
jgi:HPt (histidine-containing phosphotransfer) domain-containing protein